MSNTFKSYFESKKRDLSDKSNDGDERKKAKEINIDLSPNQDDADVFSESINSPRCVSILYDAGHTVYVIKYLRSTNLDLLSSNFWDMLERKFLKTKESWKENGLALRKV